MLDAALKEKLDHHTLSYYRLSQNGCLFPCHWHHEYELLYVEQGSALLTVNGESMHFTAGSAAWINPEELHFCDALSPGTTLSAVVFRLNDVFGVYHNRLSSGGTTLARSIALSPPPGTTAEMYQVKALLYQLLCRLEQEQKNKKNLALSKSYDSVRRVMEYMEQNYTSKLTTEALASVAHLSKYHFIRIFRAVTGTLPTSYINRLRVGKACHLLENEELPVTQAAMQVGFDSTSYFIKVFKNVIGTTPLKYRQKQICPGPESAEVFVTGR